MEKNEIEIGKQHIVLIVLCMFSGIVFNILFYDKSLGISYIIFVGFIYVILFTNFKRNIFFKSKSTWILFIIILLLSSTYFLFSNPVFSTLNFIAIPFLISGNIILFTEDNKNSWYQKGFLNELFSKTFKYLFINVDKAFTLLPKTIKLDKDSSWITLIKKIVVGLIIVAPFLLIILILLASADMVFEHYISEIPLIINIKFLKTLFYQIVIAILVYLYLFSYFYRYLNPSKKTDSDNTIVEKNMDETLNKEKKPFDAVVCITFLSCINLIYSSFSMIQLSYLFGSINSILPQGVTYAEYARKGFFELVAVTLINLSILLIINNGVKKEGKLYMAIKVLNSLLVAFTFIMLLSAHFRMSLYENTFGLTYLRILTHSFMVYILFLLIVALYKIWNDKIRILKAYIVISIISYLIVNFMNIDVIIAKNNIARYKETQKIDFYYLTLLSYDAVPYIAELSNVDDKDLSKKADIYLKELYHKLPEREKWQSFNISKLKAKRTINSYLD